MTLMFARFELTVLKKQMATSSLSREIMRVFMSLVIALTTVLKQVSDAQSPSPAWRRSYKDEKERKRKYINIGSSGLLQYPKTKPKEEIIN